MVWLMYWLMFLQVRRDNRDEVERNIREALEDFCRPENLDRELRRAMDMLSINDSSKQEEKTSSKGHWCLILKIDYRE